MAGSKPESDVVAEAERLTGEAAAKKLTVKLMGGVAIRLHSPRAVDPPFRRRYSDLDVVAPGGQRVQVEQLFVSAGYEPDDRFNMFNGHRRLLFWDREHQRQVDVFLNELKMCHVIDLRKRLDIEGPTLTPADLLVSKLQVFELNEKDAVDVAALVLDHDVASHDDDALNAEYIATLVSDDWGLYRTLTLNIEKVPEVVGHLGVDRAEVSKRLGKVREAIEAKPKSLRWKLRARVGDRVQWYELPEEVRKPYEPA